MSTVKHLILNAADIRHPHSVWKACATSPYLVPAAMSRARIMVGRAGLRYSSWRKGDTHCPLCLGESESIPHFLVSCPELDRPRAPIIKELCSLYSNDGKRPPRHTSELVSAIINGNCYTEASSISIVSLEHTTEGAQNLCSSLCHKLTQTRDHIINSALLD